MATLTSRLFRTLIRRGRLYSDKPVVQAQAVKKADKSGHPQEISEGKSIWVANIMVWMSTSFDLARLKKWVGWHVPELLYLYL